MQLNARGPAYPDLGNTVAKYRRMATKAGSISEMLPADRNAYGEAVERAIRAKQRSELMRELPSHPCPCASGTYHNTGEAIDRAMKAKHRAALFACPSQERRARKPGTWERMYDDAMTRKRGGWGVEDYENAHSQNRRIDYLMLRKWTMDYPEALREAADFDYEEAWRDNAAWDYHHEYTPDVELA